MQRVSILFVLVASAGGGCVADSGDESFIIRNNLIPAVGSCEFTAELGALSLSRGTLDLNSPIPYLIQPLFESRIVAPEGKESLRTIFLTRADIELTIGPIETIEGNNVTIDTATQTLQFASLFSAALPPNGGLATAQFDLVPESALVMIRQRVGATTGRVHAQVSAVATPAGDYYGDEIKGTPYQYPGTVTNDSNVRVVAGIGTGGTCPLAMTAKVEPGNPCNAFQDGVVDCCANADGSLACPATISDVP